MFKHNGHIIIMDKLCIIVIGLPFSGKTTWTENNVSEHIIYDDFITHYYNGEVIKACRSKSPICIIDPRLCIPDLFRKYITVMHECYGPDNIQLILFENNPTLCLANINKGQSPLLTSVKGAEAPFANIRIDNRKNIPNTITNYTSLYNIDHECYSLYSKIILPVYKE
jgi:hypothetical protein